MRGCHNCGHAVDVAAGKYRNVPWREMPCAACELVPSSAGTMCFNEDRTSWSENRGAVSWSCMDPEREEELLVPVGLLGAVVHGLLAMSPDARDTVCWRYQGLKYREIAERQGVSASAVEQRHRRTMKRWPELRQLFVEKARKQARRKGQAKGKA